LYVNVCFHSDNSVYFAYFAYFVFVTYSKSAVIYTNLWIFGIYECMYARTYICFRDFHCNTTKMLHFFHCIFFVGGLWTNDF